MNYTQLITEAQEHQKGKTCIKCKEHKLLSEFSKSMKSEDRVQSMCRSCKKEYDDNVCRFKKWFIQNYKLD